MPTPAPAAIHVASLPDFSPFSLLAQPNTLADGFPRFSLPALLCATTGAIAAARLEPTAPERPN